MLIRKNKMFSIRINEDLYEAIRKEAIRTQTNISETIRTMLFITAYKMKLF